MPETDQKSDGMAVGEPSGAYEEMAQYWEPIEDLNGGTPRMRWVAINEHGRWLPQMEKESDELYASRVAQSFLFNFYADNVSKLVAKPYSKPLVLPEDGLPEHLEPLLDNMDMNGTSLQAFGEDSFRAGLDFGLSSCLVDFTEMPENVAAREEGKAGDKRAEIARKPRPRAILISPDSLLGWRTRRGAQGETILEMIRIKETRVEPDGMFGEKTVEFVHVWTETLVQTWRKEEGDDEYRPEEARPHTFGAVPYVPPWYTNRTGFLTARPPLLDLAWITIDHWQSYSDQRNILHVARVPILFRKGIPKSELKEGSFVIGASRMVSASSKDASLGYVEPTGAAIDAGKDHLEMLERRADLLGADPMNSKGPSTATGEIRADSKATSWLLSWIEAQEVWLRQVFEFAARWTPNQPQLADEWKITIQKDFDLRSTASKEYELIQKDAADGAITDERRLIEGQRRGIYPEDMDPSTEASLAAAQAPKGLPPPPPDEDEEVIEAA